MEEVESAAALFRCSSFSVFLKIFHKTHTILETSVLFDKILFQNALFFFLLKGCSSFPARPLHLDVGTNGHFQLKRPPGGFRDKHKPGIRLELKKTRNGGFRRKTSEELGSGHNHSSTKVSTARKIDKLIETLPKIKIKSRSKGRYTYYYFIFKYASACSACVTF